MAHFFWRIFHGPGHKVDSTIGEGDGVADSRGHEPKAVLTWDPARNRESARRLAALEPDLVCFGHGAPLRDPQKLKAFVEGLGG